MEAMVTESYKRKLEELSFKRCISLYQDTSAGCITTHHLYSNHEGEWDGFNPVPLFYFDKAQFLRFWRERYDLSGTKKGATPLILLNQ